MRFFLLYFLFTTQFCFSQTTSFDKVDSLINSLDYSGAPGGVVGIMKGDEWIYRKKFGNANLEYQVPVAFDTRFNIASISKQFTAMGIVKLHLDGKLSIDDEIQKYLPELKTFDHPITIRHLLHHTSGLRSHHAIMEIAGWGQNDPRSNDDLLRIMGNQEDLNFVPGSEYLYCNTGYILMGEIIEKVSGKPFNQWMKANVLAPLGLNASYVEANATAVVPNNATSYIGSDGKFNQATPYWNYTGSGNIHATLDDVMKWYGNYMNPQQGWEAAFDMLQTLDPFNNGDPNSYAFGVEIDDYRGVKRIQHGGAVGGFRSFACAFPQQNIRIVVLTNFSSSNPVLICNTMADAVLEFDEQIAKELLEEIDLTQEEMQTYEGWYWNNQKKFERRIEMDEGRLWYVRGNNRTELRAVGKDLFKMMDGFNFLVKFEPVVGGNYSMIVGYGEPGAGIFTPFTKPEENLEFLEKFVGDYYSDELLTTYQIRLEGDSLIAEHARLGVIQLKVLRNDALKGEWPLLTLEFTFDEDAKAAGFVVSNTRARNVRFRKVNLDQK